MKYMGSKRKIRKEIIDIMMSYRLNNEPFIDMFCGGCHVIEMVDGIRLANDKNRYLIAMWSGLLEDRVRPYVIDKELYSRARNEYNKGINIEFDDFLIGWIGFMGSYNGRFFDGGYSGHDVKGRDYISENIRNTESQISNLVGVIFSSIDYYEYDIMCCYDSPCIIYCDIPYRGTKQYSISSDFDYDKFYNWCFVMREFGHTIFVSEYSMPDGFECIWSKEVTNSLNTTNTYKPIEKLYIVKGLLNG